MFMVLQRYMVDEGKARGIQAWAGTWLKEFAKPPHVCSRILRKLALLADHATVSPGFHRRPSKSHGMCLLSFRIGSGLCRTVQSKEMGVRVEFSRAASPTVSVASVT